MEQPSQTSKKRSGTVAGMKDGLKKATTDMLVLFLLRQKPMYAYEMLQEMARLSDGVLQFNTLYIAIYQSSPDSCVKCYTMFLPFLLIKIDVFS